MPRESDIQLLDHLSNDAGLRKWYERDAEAATLFLCNVVRKVLGDHSSRFKPNGWTNDDIAAYYEGASAYTRFCIRMMQKHPDLCLYDTDADGAPLLDMEALAKALTQASARTYTMVMKRLRAKYWGERVSASTVRRFLTETLDGLKDLRDANLIAVPNNGRAMYKRKDGVEVPTFKKFIVSREQVRRFRQPNNLMWQQRSSVRLEAPDALEAGCDDLQGWTLALFNREVEHLDPAHNYGERKESSEEERYECDVLVNFQLAPGVFNRDPLYKDSYNVIKVGSLGPYHFLLRAYQLALKGPPDAPNQFIRLVGDHLRVDMADTQQTVTYVADACFKIYLNGQWVPRRCEPVKKRLLDCLNGLRILDTGPNRGMAQTRLQFGRQAAEAIAPIIQPAHAQQQAVEPADTSAQALRQDAAAVLREDGDTNDADEERFVDLGEVEPEGKALAADDSGAETANAESASTPPGSPEEGKAEAARTPLGPPPPAADVGVEAAVRRRSRIASAARPRNSNASGGCAVTGCGAPVNSRFWPRFKFCTSLHGKPIQKRMLADAALRARLPALSKEHAGGPPKGFNFQPYAEACGFVLRR
jgi:hypothetical protein